MNIRKVTSLTAFLSFFIIVLTSVVMYIEPQGRVAYWADWRLLGLSKTQWGAIHINVGLLFLTALCLHIYYNWRPILAYLKDKSKKLKIFTREFTLSLLILTLFAAGTYLEVPPFSSIIEIGDWFKASAARKYGEPPYGHAELSSLQTFAKKMGITLSEGVASLEKAGFKGVEKEKSLKEIASLNAVSPQQLYLVMQQAERTSADLAGPVDRLPEFPVPGTGNLTLAEFCGQHSLNLEVLTRALTVQHLEFTDTMTLKAIAAKNDMTPLDLYARIRTITDGQ